MSTWKQTCRGLRDLAQKVKGQRGDAGGDGDGSDRQEGSSRTSTLTFIEKYRRYFRGRKENKMFLWIHWRRGEGLHPLE